MQGGVIDGDEEKVTATLNLTIKRLAGSFILHFGLKLGLTSTAAQFSDPQKFAEDLNTFARLNENRLYKLLKTCMDPQTDLKGLVKASVRALSPLYRRRLLTQQVS